MLFTRTSSTAHIKRETTLYIAFEGRPFSLEATFRRAPPPRHIRLAWPESEGFDALLPKPAQTSSSLELSFSSSHQAAAGVPTVAPFGSSMVICTMFKNEAPYLEEWLQYHRLLGVSKVSSPGDGHALDLARNSVCQKLLSP